MEREEEEEEEEEIVIVGGGIAGLATALALKRVGFHSRILESHSELRTTGAALTLFPNAWFALKALGVDHKLSPLYQTFQKSLVTNLETGVIQEISFAGTNGRNGVKSVHRRALLQALAEELEPDTIRFSSKVISIKSENILEDSSKNTTLHLDDGTVIKAKVVIGCDGIHSGVAQWLGQSQPIHSGRSAFRALSVFPDGHAFKQVRTFLGRGMRAGIIPLNSNELYWFLVINSSSFGKDVLTNPQQMLKEVTTNLAKDFPLDFLTVAEHSDLSTLTWAPLLFRAPWNVFSGRAHMGSVAIAGDAMHPMTPEIGQGGCSALEDAVILARCLSHEHNNDENRSLKWAENGLKRYVGERRWRVTWLVAAAWFSGRIQHIGGNREEWGSGAARWFRDRVFYKIIFPRILDFVSFDCGDLL